MLTLFLRSEDVISIVSTNESKILTPVVSGINFNPNEEGSSAQLSVKSESATTKSTEQRNKKYFLLFTF